MSAEDLHRNAQRDEQNILAALNGPKRVKLTRVEYLGVLVDEDTPSWRERSHRVEIAQVTTDNGNVFNDDLHVGHVGIGTHVDGVGHIEHNGEYHGGYTADEVFHPAGLMVLGMAEKDAVIGGSFKMLDMAKYLEVGMVGGGHEYTVAEIQGAMEQQGVTINAGDIVGLRSGWIKHLDDATMFNGSEPGLGVAAATFLADKQPKLIAADTVALEVQKTQGEGGWTDYPVHKLLLKDHGILIGEVFNFEKLAHAGINEGTMIIAVPQIAGCAQMQINPIVLT